MKIQDLFSKDIFRSINGVVKAEQLDEASVWQELDEFVVTKELTKHLDRFFSVYADAIDNPKDPDISGKIGVWVSGFFGSGKSHLIKTLSYLFENRKATIKDKTKQAIQFFEEKIDDAMLCGTIKRSVAKNIDVILFNIDTKADQSKGRDAILAVFLKVLNELQGYCPDHLHIAHMERYLDREGKLDAFCRGYKSLTGAEWAIERDSYMFNQDEIIKALSQTLGQSEDACHRWIDSAETDFSLTVENFSKWVKEYLNAKGPNHRILFFVDEIGQFVGQDGHLMLNLQTIVENLGVVCRGRAWVVVTSQEDIDTVLGSLSSARMNDFSKIQGRFKTRLSLSSANTDEVIQTRILEKKPEVTDQLKDIYHKNADILKNQLSFSKVGMTLIAYQTEDDFTKSYPFIPYQFKLLQKVFETIRRAGATGLHLSRGERSMLDAFQHAGQIAARKDIGTLVPLYWFYPSIESFLDTTVKRTIDQAKENPSLHEYDVLMLQALFMIRYVNEVKGSIDNLVTLCIDNIDADRFEIRKEIEESLHRLEKETLIGRSGENYFFLTNEEQDVNREIKSVELDFGAEGRLLGEIIYADIYRDTKKHRYAKTGKDFTLNRLCDLHAVSGRIEQGLLVSAISPFCEEYDLYDTARCIGRSTDDNGHILIKLPDKEKLSDELRIYLKTEKYFTRKDTSNPEIARILRERKDENRNRKNRIVEMVREMLIDADYYIAGHKLDMDTHDPLPALYKACDYLIDNTFSKMGYIERYCTNPQMEVQAILRADDLGKTFDLEVPESNPKALAEVREYIDLCVRTSKQIIMDDLVDVKFSNRPYGWPEWETVLLLSRLVVAGEIQLIMNSAVIEKQRVYEIISKTSNWKKITIRQKIRPPREVLENARKIGQKLFGEMGPDNEDDLFNFFKENFTEWDTRLKQYKTLADTGNYPGVKEIGEGVHLVSILLTTKESYAFFERLSEHKDKLSDFSDEFHDIDNFYKSQQLVWERLRKAYARFRLNQFELEKNVDAQKSLMRMKEILEATAPYRFISEVDALIKTVNKINEDLIAVHCKEKVSVVEKLIIEVTEEAGKVNADKELLSSLCEPFNQLKKEVESQGSIAHIKQLEERARELLNKQIHQLSEHIKDKGPVLKPIKEIRIGSILPKSYLETTEDVEEFISRLKKEFEDAIKNNQRIRIV